jgi:hypothetical protein
MRTPVPALLAVRLSDADVARLKMAASLSGRKASKIAREGIRKAIAEQLAVIATDAATPNQPAADAA